MFKEYLEKIQTKLLPWWNSLSKARKITFAGLSGLTIIIIFVAFSQVVKTDYQVLYRDLDPSEAGEVVDYLSESKVPYQLSQGGTAIYVPKSKVRQVRLDLATTGLPRSGIVGFEIFDQTNLGMTDFLQKVNFRRALEGELTKTIARFEEVKTARVHLVIPEPRLFKEDKKEPTASIVLYLDRHKSLSKRQIEGIIHLVATSVEGLSPESITVLDSSGKLLSSGQKSDKLAALSSNQMEMKKSVEGYLEDKTQSMLDVVIGRDHSIVRVSIDMNFDQVERTIEKYDPDNVAIRSEEINEEKQSESDSDDPDKKRDSSNSKKNTIRNYEVNKTIEHLVSQVGNIDRLRVAVSFDGTYEMVKGPDGSMVRQYVPRSQEELDKFVALVKGAVGFSEKRNDVIEVANIPFETVQDDWDEKQRINKEEDIQFWLKIVYQIIALLIIGFILWKLRIVYMKKRSKRLARQRFLEAQAEIQRKAADLIPKLSREPKLIDHVRKLANNNPNEIAKVIKTMLVD